MRFGRKRGDEERGSNADAYFGLRRQVLDLTPDQLGIASDTPVIALLMETGYPEAVATLVGVIDGSTSLYFSNGGGVIGAGAHPEVAAATERWLDMSLDLLQHFIARVAAVQDREHIDETRQRRARLPRRAPREMMSEKA